MKKVKKVTNQLYPLARSANRLSLLTGVLGNTVSREEIEQAMTIDLIPRQPVKPVVAENIRFESVTDAAKFLTKSPRRQSKDQYFDAVCSMRLKISRMCTQDCWEGYYWAE